MNWDKADFLWKISPKEKTRSKEQEKTFKGAVSSVSKQPFWKKMRESNAMDKNDKFVQMTSVNVDILEQNF